MTVQIKSHCRRVGTVGQSATRTVSSHCNHSTEVRLAILAHSHACLVAIRIRSIHFRIGFAEHTLNVQSTSIVTSVHIIKNRTCNTTYCRTLVRIFHLRCRSLQCRSHSSFIITIRQRCLGISDDTSHVYIGCLLRSAVIDQCNLRCIAAGRERAIVTECKSIRQSRCSRSTAADTSDEKTAGKPGRFHSNGTVIDAAFHRVLAHRCRSLSGYAADKLGCSHIDRSRIY